MQLLNGLSHLAPVCLSCFFLDQNVFFASIFPSFSFRVTDGCRVSDTQTYNHFAWDGRRAFAHVVNHPPNLYEVHKGEDLVTNFDEIDFLKGNSFKESALEYLSSRQFESPVKISIVISKRRLDDSKTFGNFLVIETFWFDPHLPLDCNKKRLREAIVRGQESDVLKTAPWKIIQRFSTSSVVLNAWTLESDELFLLPEIFRVPIRSDEKCYVILSNVLSNVIDRKKRRKWYVRVESLF